MKILFSFRYLFVLLLFLDLVAHSNVNLSIGESFFDFKSLITIVLIIGLLLKNRVSAIVLLMYALVIFFFKFSPAFMPEKEVEKIYYNIFLGLELSSYVRMNILNVYWLVNPLMNLSFYLAGYIMLHEIFNQLYKAKYFPFDKKR